MTTPTVTTPGDVINAVSLDIASFLGVGPPDAQATAQHAVTTIYGLMSAELRGKAPLPPSIELLAVLRGASLRYAAMITRLVREHNDDNDETGQAPQGIPGLMMPPFTGFSFPELMALHRYRQRTA